MALSPPTNLDGLGSVIRCLFGEIAERAAHARAEVPALGRQQALEVGANAACTGSDVGEPSRGPRERECARIDLGELGRRGVVEPTRRVDDPRPYRSGNAGSADDKPTGEVRVVNPHAGKRIGDGRDVGSAGLPRRTGSCGDSACKCYIA